MLTIALKAIDGISGSAILAIVLTALRGLEPTETARAVLANSDRADEDVSD